MSKWVRKIENITLEAESDPFASVRAMMRDRGLTEEEINIRLDGFVAAAHNNSNLEEEE